ncbi:PRD domain-containing protein [Erysipelothrix sp. HDW6C]|uniref:BglG family transcription antiterminator n=1 Tax=Erysipelothrix sp. HDW6C TaxID=2714930 RepID=UPI00140C313B|nr:PRD domain-containing protein [Erysipelothrix sp. HDW6C]QIK69068.1 PRD domain-containing protein [Erysipelothrix sp. HDW6C]
MLDSKYVEILNHLSSATSSIHATHLADALGKSVRTVKSYVKSINESYPGLIKASPYGYALNRERYKQIAINSVVAMPSTPDERLVYIIRSLIKKEHLNIVTIAYELHVSESTVRADLAQLKKRLDTYSLTMKVEKQTVVIQGLEKNKRRLLTSILYKESNQNFLNIESLQNNFDEYNIFKIRDIVVSTLNEAHYFVNDYALMNLILHIVVSISRIQHNNTYSDSETMDIISTNTEIQIAEKITQRISSYFQIQYSKEEVYELSLLILSSGSNINFNAVNELNIASYIDEGVLNLVDDLIKSINRYYYIDISENQFFFRFALHINNLLKRLQMGRSNKNPITMNIKQSCPLIYDCAVSVAHDISHRFNVQISDDEITYIAFHIGGALETQKSLGNKVSCIFIFPQYYDMNQNLYNHLTETFHDSLVVQNMVTDEFSIENFDVDLIITTQPLQTTPVLPVIVINPFKNERDTAQIYETIHRLKENKRRNTFKETISTMLSSQTFFLNDEPRNQQNVIDFLVSKAVDMGSVGEMFKQEIMDREAMSSTGFGKIAIPHSMRMNAEKTSMLVFISKHPIRWDTTDVNLVIMLTIAKDDRKVFADIFDPLSMMLTESVVIDQLLQATTVASFIEVLGYNFQ